MSTLDLLKLAIAQLVPVALGFVWIGRKLEGDKTMRRDLDEIRAEKLPERVHVLESLAGVK